MIAKDVQGLRAELIALGARILVQQKRLEELTRQGRPTATLAADLAQLIVARDYIQDKLQSLKGGPEPL